MSNDALAYLDVAGSRVRTHDLALTEQAIDLLGSELAMGAVVGKAGLGKTYAVGAAIESRAIDVSSMDCGVGWSSKSVDEAML